MTAKTIGDTLSNSQPPWSFYTSDGRILYVDHPESVLVHRQVVVLAPGANGGGRIAKELVFLSPDHIVRIEPTRRKPLRRIRGG